MAGTLENRDTHITLDDLITLNEEIAALTKAGVPLESGLANFGEDMPGVSGRLATRLSERLEQGTTLAGAIEAEGDALPAVYRATVLAGLRSGELTSALEGLTETAQRVAEIRRIVGMAILYPLIVVIIGWLLLAFTAVGILPAFDWLEVSQSALMSLLSVSRSTALWGAVIVPVLLVLAVSVWWVRSQHVHVMATTKASRRRMISRSGIRRLGQSATLAEVLAMLVERKTPLDEALVLAADTAGEAEWRHSATVLAEKIQQGFSVTSATNALHKLPPLIRVALLHIGGSEPMVNGLRAAGVAYRERASRSAQWLAITLPTLLTVTIGGTAVVAYAAVVFWPFLSTMVEMSNWH